MHRWARNALSTSNKIAAAFRIGAELKQRLLYNAMTRLLNQRTHSKRK
jgi:hypothetical protein